VGGDTVFLSAGFSKGVLLAVRPGTGNDSGTCVIDAAKGTDSSSAGKSPGGLRLAWKLNRNVPNKPSPVLVEDLLFLIDDGGIATCLEAKTGEQIWNDRVGGNYSASPVYAEGRIYFFSEEGKTAVLEAGRQFKILAENKLEDGFMASPAIAGKAFFLRTRTHLYRIEK
jgi:outer membrane protein assembly factor BamB